MEQGKDQLPESKSHREHLDPPSTLQTYQNLEESTKVFHSTIANFQGVILQHAEKMREAISNMYHDAVKSCIKINSVLKPVEGGIQLSATVTNLSPMPVANVSFSLSFGPVADDNNITWEALSATILMKGHHADHEPAQVTLGTDAMLTLKEYSQYTQIVHIKTHDIVQCNGVLALDFPSPAKGDNIRLDHQFGVYLIDQLSKDVVKDGASDITENNQYQDREYPITFLRHILDLHPTQGMEPGMKIVLSPIHSKKNIEITCILNEFKHNFCIVSVRFFASAPGVPFLEPLLRELDLLKGS